MGVAEVQLGLRLKGDAEWFVRTSTSGAEEKEKTAVCSDTVNMEADVIGRVQVSELAEAQS